MDLHISPTGEISIEDLIEKHQADLATQNKYGVEFKGVWVNKDRGMVFCLMEGPDREACTCVHQEAHGDSGCNVVEVSPGDFETFLSGSVTNENDFAEIKSGLMDSGYRTMFRFEWNSTIGRNNFEIERFKSVVKKYKGNLVVEPHEFMRAIFVKASQAFECAEEFTQYVAHHYPKMEYRMTVITGNPVDEHHNRFYGYTSELSEKFSKAGQKGFIYTTQMTTDLLKKESGDKFRTNKKIKAFSPAEEKFLFQVVSNIEKKLDDATFNATELAKISLLSRTQLFRKIKKCTGYTPSSLIREIRLQEAIKRLRIREDQIAQVAFDTGFNSPSYFSKMFASRFKMLPSDFVSSLKR